MQLQLTRPICFFDLETTGTNVAKDRIVEISILKIFPNGNKESKTWLVNPGVPIPPEVVAVHGISNEKVANEPSFKALSKEVYAMIKDCDLGGFNSNRFDIPLLAEEMLRADIDFDMSVMAEDGDDIKAGDIIAEIEGPARSLLTAERVALNFMSHMSGVATLTAAYVEQIKHTGAEVCDTRKTLPGLRLFQKYAVSMGGGSNHRFGLDDAILIKDNHIAVAGGIDEALTQAHMLAGHTVKIEIEVDTLLQLETVLANGRADIVMLDNFSLEDLKTGVEMCKGQITVEASGGVNLDNIRGIAECGVDYISVGALTNSAKVLDIGLDIDV